MAVSRCLDASIYVLGRSPRKNAATGFGDRIVKRVLVCRHVVGVVPAVTKSVVMGLALARMALKDLLVSFAPNQTSLAATAMKVALVSMDSVTVDYMVRGNANWTAVTQDLQDRTVV